MNREWVTLAFGILLVTVVAVVSVWQNYPRDRTEPAAEPPAATETPAPDATPQQPAVSEPARKPAAPAPQPPAPAPAPAPARLDARVPVVHKHRFGDCEGTLRAVPGTLTYSTTHTEDGFRLAFADIEAFDFDAENNNLRIRQRGGRTWNFTTRGDNAAPLAAFYREASRARR